MVVFGIGAALGGPVAGRFTDSPIGWPAAFYAVVRNRPCTKAKLTFVASTSSIVHNGRLLPVTRPAHRAHTQ